MNAAPIVAIVAVSAIARADPVGADRTPQSFYNTLRFVDEQIYDAGDGNAYSGMAVLGALYGERRLYNLCRQQHR